MEKNTKQQISLVTDVLIAGTVSLIAMKIAPELMHYLILVLLIYIVLQRMETKL